MHLSRREWLHRAGLASVGATVGLNGAQVAPAMAQAATDRLRLSDYGAPVGGSEDAGPALQRALDDLAARGGGELLIDGKYLVASPVNENFIDRAAAVRIVGHGSASQLVLRTPGATALQLGNLEHVVVQGVTFVGTAGERQDCRYGLVFSFCDVAMLRDCNFYALATLDNPGSSIVLSHRSNLTVQGCGFRGCASEAGTVSNVDWIGFRIEDCFFLDYGALGSKTLMGGGTGWIQALAPAGYPLLATNSHGVFTVRNVKCDEGARAVHVDPGASRIARVHIDGVDSNVPPLMEGALISHVDEVVIQHSFFGYTNSGPTVDGIRFSDVRNGLIERTFCMQLADRITADSACGTLYVVESTYGSLVSAAARTIVTKDGSTTTTTGPTPTTTTTQPASTTTSTTQPPGTTTSTAPVSTTTTTVGPAGPARVRSASTAATSAYQGSTSLTVPVPPGTMEGDVLVAFVSASVAPARLVAPSGWSSVRMDANGTGLESAIFVRVVGPSEPSSHRWDFTRTNVAVVMAAVIGLDTSNPVDASTARFTNYTRTPTAPSLVTTTGGDLLVMFVANQGGARWTAPTGMTGVQEIDSKDFYCCNVFTHVASETLGPAGDTGPRAAQLTVDYVQATSTLLALRPRP